MLQDTNVSNHRHEALADHTNEMRLTVFDPSRSSCKQGNQLTFVRKQSTIDISTIDNPPI